MIKAEEEFIDQMTRKCMVEWCGTAALNGDGQFAPTGGSDCFLQHAITKKWVSVPIGAAPSVTGTPLRYKILSGGWETATRFLKR